MTHSFPTRRSSDLGVPAGDRGGLGCFEPATQLLEALDQGVELRCRQAIELELHQRCECAIDGVERIRLAVLVGVDAGHAAVLLRARARRQQAGRAITNEWGPEPRPRRGRPTHYRPAVRPSTPNE